MERELAHGGAARVFLARQPDGKVVALKVLRPELAVTVTADRFFREIEVLSRFDHPGIARLLDSGETDLLIYYVMEYIEGPNLRQHLRRVKRVTTNDTLHIAYDLLDAITQAHEAHIVHRDVKPENIILSPKGPVLVDFGIARAIAQSGTDRLTRSGFSVGTSSYMSPEQVRGAKEIDHRSDLYSIGCVLFECLTGNPPFTAEREEAVLRLHIEGKAPKVRSIRSDVPDELATIIDKALAAEPEDRWQSAKEMRNAVATLG